MATATFKLAVAVFAAFTSAVAYSLPPGVPENHVAMRFDFAEGKGNWGSAAADQQGLEATQTAEGLRLRLTHNHDRPAWIESGPMNVTVIDTSFVVVRMRHLGKARVANLTMELEGVKSLERRHALPDWELPALGMESRNVALFADGQYHDYAFPVYLVREISPTAAPTRITRLRLYPAYDTDAGVGTVIVQWIRIIHAPTITRVTGCLRPRPDAAASQPQYAIGSGEGRPIPPYRLFVREGAGNDRFFANAEDAIYAENAKGDATLPYAATLSCSPYGGDRILIQGKHLGSNAPGDRTPLVSVNGKPCTNVRVEKWESELSCTVPPGTGNFVPVVVAHAESPIVSDAEPLLSYAPEPIPPRIVLLNVAATAVDIALIVPDTFAAAATTGYRLQWRVSQWAPHYTRNGDAVGLGIDDVSSSQTVARRIWGAWGDAVTGGGNATIGNLTMTTIRGLRPNTAYQFRAAIMTTYVSESNAWLQTDHYGHLKTTNDGLKGLSSDDPARQYLSPLDYVLSFATQGPFSLPQEISTLPYDFYFSHFDANSTLDHGPAWPKAALNTLLRSGGSGHYGLSLVGSATLANCNSSHACCDNYGGPGFANRMARIFATDDYDPSHVPKTDVGSMQSVYQYSQETFDYTPVTWLGIDENARVAINDATDPITPPAGSGGVAALERARNRILLDGGTTKTPSSTLSGSAVGRGLPGADTAVTSQQFAATTTPTTGGSSASADSTTRYRLNEPNDVAWSASDPFASLLAYGSNRRPQSSLYSLQHGSGTQLWEGFDDAGNVVFVPLAAIQQAEERTRLEHERNISAADYFFGLDRHDNSEEGAVRPRRRGVFYDVMGRRMVPASVHPASLCTLTCAASPPGSSGTNVPGWNLEPQAGSDFFSQGADAGPFSRSDADARFGAASGGLSPSTIIDVEQGYAERIGSSNSHDEVDMRYDLDDNAREARFISNPYITGRFLRRNRGLAGSDRGVTTAGGPNLDLTGRLPFPNLETADEPGLGGPTRPAAEGFNADRGGDPSSILNLAPTTSTFLNGIMITNVTTGSITPVPIEQPFPAQPSGNTPGASGSPQTPSTITAETVTAPCGPALRLTGAHPDQAGSMWYARQMQVREGFDTSFAYRIAQPDPSLACRNNKDSYTFCRTRGGAGFAFVIQNWHPAALGLGGTDGMGYASIRNSVAIEFDTYSDGAATESLNLHEPHENHISVHTRGYAAGNSVNHTYSLGHVAGKSLPDLTTGIHLVRVLYNPIFNPSVINHPAFSGAGSAYLADLIGSPTALREDGKADGTSPGTEWRKRGFGTLSIFIDDSNEPVLIVPMNLASTIDVSATHGRAWVGFTASTGTNIWQVHDILAWHFTELRMDYTTTGQ
jgi:Bacterial lectin/IPT/TIG domain